jgi:hypothetical protein
MRTTSVPAGHVPSHCRARIGTLGRHASQDSMRNTGWAGPPRHRADRMQDVPKAFETSLLEGQGEGTGKRGAKRCGVRVRRTGGPAKGRPVGMKGPAGGGAPNPSPASQTPDIVLYVTHAPMPNASKKLHVMIGTTEKVHAGSSEASDGQRAGFRDAQDSPRPPALDLREECSNDEEVCCTSHFEDEGVEPESTVGSLIVPPSWGLLPRSPRRRWLAPLAS